MRARERRLANRTKAITRQWDILQSPFKHTGDYDAAKWPSQRESVRKDVEDVFGILKHRSRYMNRAVELHNQDEIDNMFFTCCILNNVLLKYDGYDKRRDDVIWKMKILMVAVMLSMMDSSKKKKIKILNILD